MMIFKNSKPSLVQVRYKERRTPWRLKKEAVETKVVETQSNKVPFYSRINNMSNIRLRKRK